MYMSDPIALLMIISCFVVNIYQFVVCAAGKHPFYDLSLCFFYIYQKTSFYLAFHLQVYTKMNLICLAWWTLWNKWIYFHKTILPLFDNVPQGGLVPQPGLKISDHSEELVLGIFVFLLNDTGLKIGTVCQYVDHLNVDTLLLREKKGPFQSLHGIHWKIDWHNKMVHGPVFCYPC